MMQLSISLFLLQRELKKNNFYMKKLMNGVAALSSVFFYSRQRNMYMSY